jgi:hypothetical protein
MGEIWRDIPGYEGKYQASTHGRIRSVTREITQMSRYGKPFTRTIRGRVLRPGPVVTGHLYVVLGHGAHGTPVHTLVALTFIGPRPAGLDVCHNDGNPKNNRLDNLRYDTRTNNILDTYKNGGAWRTLTSAQVAEIRAALAAGVVGQRLAEIYGVTGSCISSIRRGRSHKCSII